MLGKSRSTACAASTTLICSEPRAGQLETKQRFIFRARRTVWIFPLPLDLIKLLTFSHSLSSRRQERGALARLSPFSNCALRASFPPNINLLNPGALSSCRVALGAAAREGRSTLRSVRCTLVETRISPMPTIGVQRKDGWLFVVSFSGVSFSGLRVVALAICCRRIRPPRLGNKPYTFRPHHKLNQPVIDRSRARSMRAS